MKKRVFSILTILLLVSLVLLTACNKKNPAVSSNTSSAGFSNQDNTSDLTSGTDWTPASVDNTTSTSSSTGQITESRAEAEKEKLNLNGASVKILTHIDPNSSDSRLLKSRFKEYCNGNLVFVTAPYEKLGEKLISLIMSNDSPDIYAVRSWDFPGIMYKDVFQELDSKIDFKSDIWIADKTKYDNFLWMGKHYIIGGAGPGSYLWYNKRMMQEAGIDKDPGELVAEGNWTWDTFLQLAKDMTDPDAGIYGFTENSFGYALMAAFKEDIIKFTDNGIESNIKSPNVAKAMEFYGKLYATHKVASPTPENRIQDFANGKIAMMYEGHWFANIEPIKKLHDAGVVTFTYLPKATKDSDYIFPADVSGYAVAKGAKNVKGAVAFLTMGQIQKAYADEERAKWHQASNHNAEEIKITDFVMDKAQKSPTYSFGINEASTAYWAELAEVKKGTSWSTIAERLDPKINKAIDDLSK